jgi:acetyl-CoA synthetase
MVEKHRITQLYTAPTAIRALMRFGDEPVRKHDRSSLRILGEATSCTRPMVFCSAGYATSFESLI